MKILFLHDRHEGVGGVKPTHFRKCEYEVVEPNLDDDDFDRAVLTAQEEFNQQRPDVVVGCSRGAAVAMAIAIGRTPMVLLSPEWKKWGKSQLPQGDVFILHSRKDESIPYSDSEELLAKNDRMLQLLFEVGEDHRLEDKHSLTLMTAACIRILSIPFR